MRVRHKITKEESVITGRADTPVIFLENGDAFCVNSPIDDDWEIKET